jgi:long-chain acyl-CoA synthetase
VVTSGDVMRSPAHWAAAASDQVAAMVPGGGQVTYAELDARSEALARWFRSRGLVRGAHVAVLLTNELPYFEVVWATQRAGLYCTPINSHLTAEEIAYILDDCGATCLVASARLAEVAGAAADSAPAVVHRLAVGGAIVGFEPYEDVLTSPPTEPLADESEGSVMYYSSGTTGRPKGVRRPLPAAPFGTVPAVTADLYVGRFRFRSGMRYLCPAPLYHAAPLGASLAVQRLGGTVVLLEQFDARQALEAIDRHRVTHAQFVPTMFIRMLRLDADVRERHDLSSLEVVLHAAAPCPAHVKRAMIDWLGPVLLEYYSGTEGIGMTFITSDEWLRHPGSVGRPVLGDAHIVDDDGEPLGPGERGEIWFSGGNRFEYHNDPAKTAASHDHRGWSTLGDIGYLDEDGYLYLTDRASFMIVSGGVNIYPREIEDVLIAHPGVEDVCVIGVPNAELGEEVKAVVQPRATPPPAALGPELLDLCRRHLARHKCPRSIDFVPELPRLPTGKLATRTIRDPYWEGHATRIL